ncbi:hypothetical protein WA026_015652 [Henosepilachna vigintioctopunctata]|uniref:Protein trunk n=1 Tax=Henosepilachna vigintioctopunctata TaxID=420089 RepID=A0AAW1VED5_9CUCU
MEVSKQCYLMINIFCVFIFNLFISETLCFVQSIKLTCKEIPVEALQEILGPSFNRRYMSVEKPVQDYGAYWESKRTSSMENEFFVDELYSKQLIVQPAWEVKNHVKISRYIPANKRGRRQVISGEEWHCESRLVWKDLGPDYFPRYLRTVECISDNCWFTRLKCKPRSFAVKLLRRKKHHCAMIGPETIVGFPELKKDLREVWVWEEKAVNFCCDCAV